jgi:hypothetical protein
MSMAKPTSIDNHCYCAMPACSAEIYDHQPYVHDGGQYWHLDCWMKIYEVPVPPMLKAEREQAAIDRCPHGLSAGNYCAACDDAPF